MNCAAIPTELIESELFGHKRGAFTGAVNDKQGLMELANNGTLLLDEIGDLTPNLQVKLLRVLQDREFRPVGSTKVLKTNFRLISATNVNTDQALKEGRLREDLYFRINTLMLPVPALRERPTDIPLMAEYFLRKYAAQHGKSIMSFHRGRAARARQLRMARQRPRAAARHRARRHPHPGLADRRGRPPGQRHRGDGS